MNNQSGFTLIEGMIALVILAVGLSGVLGAQVMSIKMRGDDAQWSEARFIAESELDQRTAISLNAIDTVMAVSPSGVTTVTRNHLDYQVQYWYSLPSSNQYRVSVRVTFPGALTPVSLTTEKNGLL